jgi:hypothetical protein
LALELADSPYGYPTIGSTMVCRADAYAVVAGMTRRAAGEDFYFLQKLQKTGGIDVITATTVYPSPRASERVPFGTGAAVARGLREGGGERRVYNPESYRIIGAWLAAVTDCGRDADELLEIAESIRAPLRRFLERHRFGEVWPRLRRNASSPEQLRAQFHRWFDGFRTLRLIHHLRDDGLADRPLYEALEEIAIWAGEVDLPNEVRAAAKDPKARIEVLGSLRRIQRQRWADSLCESESEG